MFGQYFGKTTGPTKSIQLMRNHLNSEELNLVKRVVQRYAHMANPENILSNALMDPDINYRELALQNIIDAKTFSAKSPEIIRTFKPLTINFDADTYWNPINWNTTYITNPPLISDISVDILGKDTVDGNLLIPKVPCHTQAVARTVKLITEKSLQATSYEERHGYILSTLESRNKMPQFNTKKDF